MATIKKNTFLFLLIIPILLIVTAEVSAVGILGSNDFFIFEPGIQKIYNFGVLSNTDRVMDHGVGVNGDLDKYATLSTDVLKDLAPGEVAYFSLNLSLPNELSPGMHSLTLCAGESETRGSGGREGTSIGTKAAVCLVIRVLSLYPEKLAEFEFYASDVSSGEIDEMRMEVRSLSQQNMLIRGDIDVYSNSSGSLVKIVSLTTPEKILNSGKSETLFAYLNTTNLDIGEYIAKATLHFDENTSSQEKTFKIGNLSMEIMNFTDTIYKNKVNKIEVYTKSRWNSKIDGVYSEVFVKDGNQTIKASSSTESFEPWQIKPLIVFLDAKNISVGDHNFKIILYYGEKTAEVNGVLKVREKIELASSTIFLTAVILLLMIVFIILLIRTMKKMKELEKRVKKKK